MAQSHSHDDHGEAHEPHPHPPLPPVHDEAEDSPWWLPVSGLALLAVIVFVTLVRGAMSAPAAEPAAIEPAAEEAEGQPEGEAAAE